MSESVDLQIMTRRMLVVLLCGFMFMAATMDCQAAAEDSPYLVIVARNPFGLKPRPKPTLAPLASLPPVEVYLTGMYRLRGKKGVLLQIVDKATGSKPDLPPPLREGDVHGRVKIVAIQIDKSAVVVRIDGKEQTLTFEKNALKIATAAPPGVVSAQRFSVPALTLPRAYRGR